ncbi:MAG: hypothetical protein RLZ69_192 [Actinomycetota bacterium]
MLLRALVSQLTEQFAQAGIEAPNVEAEVLIAEVLGINRGQLGAQIITEGVAEPQQLETILAFADRRAAREPLQHLTGRAYFRNLELSVGKGVFIPRPETELLAQLGIDALRAATETTVKAGERPLGIDLGTGSGAIALALATEVPGATIHAVEYSEDAYPWTTKNFDKYRAAGADANLRQGDLRVAFAEFDGLVDVVVTNPPYIPVDMVPIYPEVALHDPALALYGGEDGLDLVRAASKTGLRLLKPGGFFAVEHADIQGPSVVELLRSDGWLQVQQHQDFNQRDRVVSAVRP